MQTQVWVNHTKFRLEFEFGNDPICIYIQNECIKNKKKNFVYVKLVLVWFGVFDMPVGMQIFWYFSLKSVILLCSTPFI